MQQTKSLSSPIGQTSARQRAGSAATLLLLWVIIPLLVLAFLVIRFEWVYRDKIYPGVQIMGVDLSGMTREEARLALEEAVAAYEPPPVSLRYGDQVWSLNAEDLGVQVLVEDSLNQAFALGRNGDLLENLAAQWRAFWQGEVLEPVVHVHPGQVEQTVRQLTAPLNRSVTESSVALSELQVVITASQPGQVVDVEDTVRTIVNRIEGGMGGIVDVRVKTIPAAGTVPLAGKETIEEALSQPILLSDARGEFQFSLDPATLASVVTWVSDDEAVGQVRAEVDREALYPIVQEWAEQVYRPPLDARFDFNPKTQQLIELAPSANGYELDVDATVDAIATAIQAGEKQVELPVKVVKPAVASEDAPNFGIKELVARGTTRFAGSSRARVKNIEVAASKFVGVVIPPGGVFSFNKYVGDVTAANGFEDSLIIAGDRTAVGVGGGVCQVSTTVFRASFFGGFPTVERWAHGYVVSYYGKPGIDATVYTPHVDFKFKNTTGAYLLIKPIVNTKKGILTFEFYGTDPGWKVEVGEPQYSNRKPPPTPLYIEDPTMPPGKVVQFDWAVEGLDAKVPRKVWDKDGNLLIDEVLKSKYKPWQAKYRFGPGFTPPPGAEVKWANR
jgi:vancomycin resistance protein YoaR